MNILFVCSGNSKVFTISPFIKSQGDSLESLGNDVDIYLVVGNGIVGYIKNIPKIISMIKISKYDIIHAHYSLCGFLVWLTIIINNLKYIFKESNKINIPLVVSLMGSDIITSKIMLIIISFFSKYIWSATIVKSHRMKNILGDNSVYVIPNGINLNQFNTKDKIYCKNILSYNVNSKIILFGSDPGRPVKNFELAKSSYNMLLEKKHKTLFPKIELITLGYISHNQIPIYLNACDVVLLTSMWEGSPNIIKEAMACNIPIVCTDVGDVKWLLDGLEGCYIVSQDPIEIANKLLMALNFNKKTKGRERIIQLGLDSKSIAREIVKVYEKVIN